MTAPEIKTDHATVAEAVAALRDRAATITTAVGAAAASVAAAAAKPVPPGARPSPAMAAAVEAMQALQTSTADVSADVTAAATSLAQWEAGLGVINQAGATAVEAQGEAGGGSW